MIPDELKKPFWTAVAIAVALIIGLFSTYVLNMGDDNPVEQASEEFIEHVSGIKVNLSEGD